MKKFINNILDSRPMFFVIPMMILVSIGGIISGKLNLNDPIDRMCLIYFVIGVVGLILCVHHNVKKELKLNKKTN